MDDIIDNYRPLDHAMNKYTSSNPFTQDTSTVLDHSTHTHARLENVFLREALREAWRIFDRLGAHQSDDARLAILHSPDFASAAYRVRTAILKACRD